MVKLSRYFVVSPPFTSASAPHSQLVLFSTRSQRAFVLSVSLWKMLSQGFIAACSSQMRRELEEALVLVDAASDELQAVLAVSEAAIRDSTVLYECIQPTGFCNFGCDYCGQDHTKRNLNDRNARLLVERVQAKLAAGSYTHLQIGWFGGEPLAAMSVITQLSASLQQVASNCRCTYGANVVTNGFFLTPTTAHTLQRDCGVTKVEVTLDGARQAHDARRTTARGAPSFDVIHRNIMDCLAADLDLRITLRCNVDRRNAEQIAELIQSMAAHAADARLSLYFAPVHDWGNDASSVALPADDYAEREVEWLAEMLTAGFQPALLPAAKPIVCMAVNQHAELIDPSGQHFNCTEVSLVPAHGTPNVFARGTLTEDRHSPAAAKLGGFLEGVRQHRFGCSDCPMLPVCGGACPKQWEAGQVPCPSAKRNLPQRLLLAQAASTLAGHVHAQIV